MCLGGFKDLSIIAPQSDRLAIHTLVAKMPNNLIAEAIENELARSGYDWGVPMRSGDVRIARLMRIRQRQRRVTTRLCIGLLAMVQTRGPYVSVPSPIRPFARGYWLCQYAARYNM